MFSSSEDNDKDDDVRTAGKFSFASKSKRRKASVSNLCHGCDKSPLSNKRYTYNAWKFGTSCWKGLRSYLHVSPLGTARDAMHKRMEDEPGQFKQDIMNLASGGCAADDVQVQIRTHHTEFMQAGGHRSRIWTRARLGHVMEFGSMPAH